MKKIIALLVIFLLSLQFLLSSPVDCEIYVEKISEEGGLFRYSMTVIVPQGWKLSKRPSITPFPPENTAKITYLEGDSLKKINETTYKTNFAVHRNNGTQQQRYLELSVQCALCSNICTIVSKNVKIDLEHTKGKQVEISFLLMLAIAFLGGFLLNAMPCVLPVILLKLRSLFHSAPQRKVALFASIIGNYFSFLIFALAISIMKLSGGIVGWGMHFQSVSFLKTSLVVLFLMTLYSFEILMFSPSVEIQNEKRGVFIGNFISSVVATIIAMPCTAPFLGTAATFAMAKASLSEMFFVFFMMASGFSMPYILSMCFSKCEMFSKISPGKTSKIAKKVSNFGISLAFLWMLWLLHHHLNSAMTIVCVALFAAATILFKKNQKIAATFVTAGIFLLPDLNGCHFAGTNSNSPEISRAIESELAEQRVVILNISADWCMTCKYNKMHVLSTKRMQKILKNHRIRLIEEDMTKKNDDLMKFIHSHGRIGIPITVVYGPNAKDGILLKEIFSIEDLEEAIKSAGNLVL